MMQSAVTSFGTTTGGGGGGRVFVSPPPLSAGRYQPSSAVDFRLASTWAASSSRRLRTQGTVPGLRLRCAVQQQHAVQDTANQKANGKIDGGHDKLDGILKNQGLKETITEAITNVTLSSSNMASHLCMVDALEKLGIAHHFSDYVQSVLVETYKAWLGNEDKLHSNTFTCAIAFRLLRMHGYDISPEVFNKMDVDRLLSYNQNTSPQIATTLELHKASQLTICHDDNSLKKMNSSSTHFLTQTIQNLTSHNAFEKQIIEEVEHNLQFPFYECLERLEYRKNIETYNINIVNSLKSSFMFQDFDSSNILSFAMDEFNFCQTVFQKELHILQRWFQEKRLDRVAKYGLNGLVYSYLAALNSVIPIEFYDARLAWAKCGLLITVFDDFFDVTGSSQERENMVYLCQRWESNYKNQCCSEKVYILYNALYSTVEELGAKASAIHGYTVTSHIIELWVDVVNTMRQEADWQYSKSKPSLEEQIEVGYVSFGLGAIMCPAMYFVGAKLSWDIVRSQEYQQLFQYVSIFGRLINDIAGFEREDAENKATSVGLVMYKGNGNISVEDAKKEVWDIINDNRDKLATLVFRSSGSVVPRECKDLFWNMCRFLFNFYGKIDGLRNIDSMAYVKAIIEEPITSCS